jgi:hypothetical protein
VVLYARAMPLALSDSQLEFVMTAAGPLDPAKRVTLMERIAGQLRQRAGRHISDAEVERATRTALRGLVQEPAA